MAYPGGNPLSDPNNSDDQLGVNEHEPKELGKDLGHHLSLSPTVSLVWSMGSHKILVRGLYSSCEEDLHNCVYWKRQM